jgi:hypothetical protein
MRVNVGERHDWLRVRRSARVRMRWNHLRARKGSGATILLVLSLSSSTPLPREW